MNSNLIGNVPNKVLVRDFFNRPTLEVCADLLGKKLCRRHADGSVQSGIITEVEGYLGVKDRAAHSFGACPPAQAKNPRRFDVMFGPPGHWYVYLCYGLHEMLNVVTEGEGSACAILIRAVADCSGPGRLTKNFQINRRFNGLEAEPRTGLWLEDTGLRLSRRDYVRTPRIGIDYAGPIWSKKPYRFLALADRLQKRLSQVVS